MVNPYSIIMAEIEESLRRLYRTMARDILAIINEKDLEPTGDWTLLEFVKWLKKKGNLPGD